VCSPVSVDPPVALARAARGASAAFRGSLRSSHWFEVFLCGPEPEPSVEEREFAVSATPLTAADLAKDAATLQDARIWDWRALEPTNDAND
jgi:hypothetical protein